MVMKQRVFRDKICTEHTHFTHSSSKPTRKHAIFTHVDLNGVGRHSPDEAAGEGSLRRSVLWKFWETVLLDHVSTGTQINVASFAAFIG